MNKCFLKELHSDGKFTEKELYLNDSDYEFLISKTYPEINSITILNSNDYEILSTKKRLTNNEIISMEIYIALNRNYTIKMNELIRWKKYGVNLNLYSPSTSKKTLLEAAFRPYDNKIDIDVVKYLVENGAKLTEDNLKTALYRNPSISLIKYIIEKGNFELKDEYLSLPIQWSDNTDTLEYLLEQKLNPNKHPYPLTNSIFYNKIDSFLLLLKHNASPHNLDNFGNNSLMIASDNGRFEMVRHLVLNYNIDVDITNNELKSAIDLAKTDEIKNFLKKYSKFY